MKYSICIISVFFNLICLLAENNNQDSMQEWQYPYNVQHLTINDSLEIAYIDEGKGEKTLVFVHGLGSNLKAWTKNIETLKKQYRCIALDLPGYGKSSQGAYAFDMSFFAQSIRQFVQELALEEIVLVGHSMGAQISMKLLLSDFEVVQELILIAPAGFETFTPQEKQWMNSIYTPAAVKATPEAQIIQNFHINFHKMPTDAQFMIDDRLEMRKTPTYNHYCQMVPQCVSGMLEEPVFDRLSEITIPCLILFGENDSLIPNKYLHPELNILEVAESGHQIIPNSSLEMIPSAGHFVQWEQSVAVNQCVLEFLEESK